MNKTLPRAEPAYLEERRDLALKNAEKEAEKERFGLFTQPSPLGLGDCRYEPNHHPRDADGNVLMQPANFYTSPMKYQKTSEVYFDNSNFLNKEKHKEPYISYTKIHQRMKQRPNPQKKTQMVNGLNPSLSYQQSPNGMNMIVEAKLTKETLIHRLKQILRFRKLKMLTKMVE